MTFVEAARWLALLAGTVVLVGTGAANWAVLVGYLATRKRGSMTPLVGGVVAAVAFALSPVTSLRSGWWLPLILDPGCALWAALYLLWAIRRRPADKRSR